MSIVYVTYLAQIKERELIKERLQSYLVKNDRGFNHVAWKSKRYSGCFGYEYYNTEKSFLNKDDALRCARQQAKVFIEFHEMQIELALRKVISINACHRERCPWSDYNDSDLFDGDMIEHPNGETGIIEFHKEFSGRPHLQWLVNYGEKKDLSRLFLQLGEKGQAVKVFN